MRSPKKPKLPWWLLSRYVLWAWLLVNVIAALVGVGFVYNAFDSIRQANGVLGSLYARVLEDHTARAIGNLELTITSLKHSLDTNDADEPPPLEAQQARLAAALAGQPLLRSISIADSGARISASTNPANIGQRLPATVRQALSASGKPAVSDLIGGRDLADAGTVQPGKRMFVTLSAPLDSVGSKPHFLILVLNLDYIANQHELLLSGQELHAALVNYKGEVLTFSESQAGDTHTAPTSPGSNLAQHEAFTRFLPAKESGQFKTDHGLDGNAALSNFKALRILPWILIVERPWSALMHELRSPALHAIAVVLVVSLLLTVLAKSTRRGLLNHELMTQRLQHAHDAMAITELRRWSVLEASLDGIITINIDGHIVDFNRAAEQMFGHQSTDVIGLPLHTVIVPAHLRDAHEKGMERYRASGQERVLNKRIEIEALRSNGEQFPVELTIVPVQCGEERYFTATIRDITHRVKMDEEMRTLLRSYKDATTDLERQKIALDAHAIVSITDDAGRIVYANAKLQQISGYAPHELLGQTHQILKSGEQGEEFYAKLWRTISRGDIWHGELINRRKDGERYWVAGTIVPVPGEEGRPRQYISIQTDISAGRKAEQALAQMRSRELDIGSRIQASLLVTPPPSQVNGNWLSAYHLASQGIDGDFVDVIRMGEHCVDIITGDVMGKGVPAALMGAATKLQFSRSTAELLSHQQENRHLPTPVDIVTAVHGAMTPHLQALDAFVTLSYIRLDTQAGTLTWVGCGHEETIVIRADRTVTSLPNQHPPLGVLDDPHFVQDTCSWHPGDALFACSDGVTDAQLVNGERIGRPRLLEAILRLTQAHRSSATIVHRLRQELLHEGVCLTDDLTMLLAQHIGHRGDINRIEVPCSHASLRQVRSFLSQGMQAASLPEETAAILEVGVVEVFTNVVRHAKGLLAGAPIEVVVRITPDQFEVEVLHLGEAFTPPEEIIMADLDTFPEGGFGLTIVRNSCDHVAYLHHDGVNTVRMTLHRQGGAHPIG